MIITNPNQMTIEEISLVNLISKVNIIIEDGVAKFAREVQGHEQNQN